MLKIILIDDHQLFLDGVSQILPLHIPNLEVFGCCSVSKAQQIIAEHGDVDLILVDLDMPDVGGLAFLSKNFQSGDVHPVAVLSASQDINVIQQVLQSGSLGFIPKTLGSADLVNAVQSILDGHIFIPADIKAQIDAIAEDDEHTLADITPRQLEVLALLSQGLSNCKIAESMFISEHTVKSHVKQLFQKLEADNRLACVTKAKDLGLLR